MTSERDRLLAAGYEDRFGLLLGPRCPPEVKRVISLQRPLHISARQSGEPSQRVYRAIARDASEAAAELLVKLDIYVSDQIPASAAIVDALAATKRRGTYTVLGNPNKKFSCAFAPIDLRPRGVALFLTLSAGSSTELSAHDRNSPVAVNLADDLVTARSGLLFGKRSDRLWRQGWGQAPVWAELDLLDELDLGVFVADGHDGLWSKDDFAQASRFLQGKKDRKQGRATARSTRMSMLGYTGENVTVENGSFTWHMPSTPPPGLTRIRLVGRHAAPTIKRLYLDTPSNYPPQETVLSVLPRAMNEHGEPADQIANLRWYLTHAGRPDWTVAELGREMIRRGYATDSARTNGPTATYQPGQEYQLQETIWANLEMFETGIHTRPMLDRVVTVTGIFPTDGKPWARPEDFARIRQWRRGLTSLYAARATYTFSGVPAHLDGRPVKMLAHPTPHLTTPGEAATTYAFEKQRRSEKSQEAARRGTRARAYLQHEWIAEAILRAIHRAQSVPVPLALVDADESQIARLNGQIYDARLRLDAATAERRRLERDISERLPGTDEHVMPASQRSAGWRRVEELDATLPALTEHVAEKERDLEDYMHALATSHRGVEAQHLASMFVSLLDPTDVTHRHTWRQAMQDLTITTHGVNRAGARGTAVTFTFTLLLTDGDTTVALPASGTHDLHSLDARPADADAMLAALRAGIPLDWENNDNGSTQRKIFRYLREETLQLTDGRTAFMQCRVPELLRLGMAVLLPDPEMRDVPVEARLMNDEELVATFTRPDLLAQRIARIYPTLTLRNGWLVRTSRPEVTGLVAAAHNAGSARRQDFASETEWRNFKWVLTESGRDNTAARDRLEEWHRISTNEYELLPCQHCGSHHRALMGYRDAAGYVCLRCRRDRAGVTWPGALFDPYIREPELWNALGHALPVAGEEHFAGRQWTRHPHHEIAPTPARPGAASKALGQGSRRRRRPISDVSASDLLAATSAYRAGEALRAVAARYNVRQKELSSHLRDRGLLRVRGASAARAAASPTSSG